MNDFNYYGLKIYERKEKMKYLLLVTTLLFTLSNITFAQEYKKVTASIFKKHVVGKTGKSKETKLTWKKNGSLEGVWQSASMNAVIKGNYTFTEAQGFCRVATITLSNGVIRERPRECFRLLIKGNKMLKVGNTVYKIQN